MKKFWILVIGIILIFWMTGCSSPTRQAIPDELEERAQNRQACEDLGGEYHELKNGLTNTFTWWECDLSSRE